MSTGVSHPWSCSRPFPASGGQSEIKSQNLPQPQMLPTHQPQHWHIFSAEGQEYKDQIHSIFLKQGITDGIKTAVVIRQGSACVAH